MSQLNASHAVEVFIDRDVWMASAIHCHPLVNTATLSVSRDGVERFLASTGHAHRLRGQWVTRRKVARIIAAGLAIKRTKTY